MVSLPSCRDGKARGSSLKQLGAVIERIPNLIILKVQAGHRVRSFAFLESAQSMTRRVFDLEG